MAFSIKNLAVWLVFALLALFAAATLSLSGARGGPTCSEVGASSAPGFAALPGSGTAACIRIRLR